MFLLNLATRRMEIAAEVVHRVHGSQRWLQSNPRKTAQRLLNRGILGTPGIGGPTVNRLRGFAMGPRLLGGAFSQANESRPAKLGGLAESDPSHASQIATRRPSPSSP